MFMTYVRMGDYNETVTVECHSNGPVSLSKRLGKSGGGSLDWYLYLDGHLANILPILGEACL